MALQFEYSPEDNSIRLNTLGTLYGSSLEDFEAIMAAAIDKIVEVKKVSRIILAETREYEYDWEQTRLLVEIANALDEIVRGRRLLSVTNISIPNCDRHTAERSHNVQRIVIDLMRRDPIGAYAEVLREIRKVKIEARKNPYHVQCYAHYVNNSLAQIQRIMESTTLIQMIKDNVAGYHIGDRTLYREIFHPTIRPNFMLTRFMSATPKEGQAVDRYKIGDIEVEIYRIPSKSELVYHVIPPEFQLTEDKYMLLDAARRYMAEHKPVETEFSDPERAREIFSNIGRDMIRDLSTNMGIFLSPLEIENITKILTRYTAGFGVLEILLADEKIQDIYINSPIGQNPIYINHADYNECSTNLIPTKDDAESWATRFRIASGRPLDEANPVLDTDINVPGGRARVAAITKTLSPEGLAFAFRRHRDKPWTLPLFIKAGAISPLFAGVMSFLVDGSASILIAGGRGSGKTSLLNAMMLEISPNKRILTVEDTIELAVDYMRKLGYNIERLKSRSVITHIETEMAADEALRTALRLGDSSLIVGEVRSLEAKALYEAMRIGALSNVVAGTIHGESPYGVYDRVVNDLGVPSTSFKATDIIVISKMLRSADGLHKFRRVTELTEVRKHWKTDPYDEKGFVNLMEYSASADELKPTEILSTGESEIINRIASLTREWEGRWEDVWENIQLRANIKKAMVDYSIKLNFPELIEAPWVTQSNEQFHIISSRLKEETGYMDPKEIFSRWDKWFSSKIKERAPRMSARVL
ncbi:MAG: type II/IV secretion system ATPase subunit [Candidatus Aenigmarchaeota archaeon]|nr:type II/IV secretion system ATPase subunit [Candidatus Aenigmarchaeota archaeon]